MRHLIVIVMVIFLLGCNTTPDSTLSPTYPSTNTFMPATMTLIPTEIVIASTFTVTITPGAKATPSFTSIPPCINLIYEDYAQVELFSPQGIRVLVDVYDPELLSEPVSDDDILLTTHTHWDHVNSDFQESFPGEHLRIQAGTIKTGDVLIQGIPSAHNTGDALIPEGGTNYIYLIEIGGLRIAHFGDIGQDTLTAEQLDLLGGVDVAITQLANPYSDMSAENQKGIKLMKQVMPRMIIPTHINLDSARLALTEWQGLYADRSGVTICAADFTNQTQILFLGQSAQQFAERLNLTQVDW